MGIPALRSGGQLVSESTSKAEILNHQFESVFHNQGLIQKLEARHRRVARFACRNYDRHITKTLDLKWDSLQMCCQANRLTLLYKSIKGQAATPAQTFLIPVVRPTRRNNSLAFIRPQASKDVYKNSSPPTTHEWNILPEAIVKAPTSEIFKEQVTNK